MNRLDRYRREAIYWQGVSRHYHDLSKWKGSGNAKRSYHQKQSAIAARWARVFLNNLLDYSQRKG